MVGQVLLRPEPVDKPEHLHLSNARKLSNQRGTPHYLEDTKEIFIFAIKYMAVIILGIPLYALILHIVYELTMIPFSILDVLKEIRNKQDKDTKN